MFNFRDDERQAAHGERLKAAFRGTVRPPPRQARARLDEAQLAARIIDWGREVERLTKSEIVLPNSALEAIDEAVSARFPEEPYGAVAERFRARQIEVAKGTLTLDGQIEGVPPTREVFLNTYPEIRADLADFERFKSESQEQARDVLDLVKMTSPGLDETAAEAHVRQAAAEGRDVRRALLEFSAETSDEAHEALVDFHVATAPESHQYDGDGRQDFADVTDAQLDEALDRPAVPKARESYSQDDLDRMSDEDLDAATDAAVADAD